MARDDDGDWGPIGTLLCVALALIAMLLMA
jgi:hypothetical protein